MHLLYFYLMKVNLSKNGKENILIMMDAFSKFSVTVVTPYQKP